MTVSVPDILFEKLKYFFVAHDTEVCFSNFWIRNDVDHQCLQAGEGLKIQPKVLKTSKAMWMKVVKMMK